jgi:hypothetical protein
MSHKGSWNRVQDHKSWDECPLWGNIEKKKAAKQPKVKEKAKIKIKNNEKNAQ